MVLPALFWGPTRYSAFTSGLQALGLAIGLTLAILTLGEDQTARKVDRTVDLHRELVSGEVGIARRRLAALLRIDGPHTAPPRVRQPKTGDLANDPALKTYDTTPRYSETDGSPYDDRVVLLRFFERANATRRAGVVDPDLLYTLIGPHALWWDAALWNDDRARDHRRALSDLASWTAERVVRSPHGDHHAWMVTLTPNVTTADFSDWPDWALSPMWCDAARRAGITP